MLQARIVPNAVRAGPPTKSLMAYNVRALYIYSTYSNSANIDALLAYWTVCGQRWYNFVDVMIVNSDGPS